MVSAKTLIALAAVALLAATAADARSMIRCRPGYRMTWASKRTCSCKPRPGPGGRPRRLGSLIFVIDTTGSMGRVIRSVKNQVNAILTSNNRFRNYVIASYGDPYRIHRLKTTSKSQIRTFLNGLRARGGGDCPEYALSGTRDAAALADRNSVLFLFTDASAKDARIKASVARQLKRKSIRFFTVASGRLCGRGSEYNYIASATGGQVAKLGKGYTSSVMNFIRKGVRGDVAFSAFPRTAGALRGALRGHCGCRYVTRSKCVGTGGVKPPRKPTRKPSSGSGSGGASGGWVVTSHVVGHCVDPYTGKKYSKGATWTSKGDGMCHSYRCTLDKRSSHPIRSDCLDNRGRCVRATARGTSFRCKVGGSVSTCQCVKKGSEVYVMRSYTSGR